MFNSKSCLLTSTDIANGYCTLTPKGVGSDNVSLFNVVVCPTGGIIQTLGESFTAMNGTSSLAIIWKTSGTVSVTGISSPVYPTVGMSGDLVEGDTLIVIYES